MKKIAQACCVTLLTYCFSLGMACAQNYLPPTVKDALRSGELSSSQMAASVVPLNDGALRLSWRDHVKVTPASTEKMVTTLAALELLGPDWRWKTAFSYEGSIVNGVLHGTLFIKGGGDPKYVSENLWRDLSRLKSLGIDGIDGDVVIDRSYFEKDRQDPEFEEDWDRPYTAAADAALFNYSSIALTISPQKNEKKALVTVSPQVPGLIVPKTVPLSSQKGCVRWRQALELDTDNPWRPDFEGALPSGCEEKVLSYLISDANGYWQAYLRTLSSQVGLIWQGKVREGKVPPQAVGLFDVWSDDLGSLVKLTNKFSNFTIPIMKKLGLYDRACVIISGDETGKLKPHPDNMLVALNKMRALPQETPYVGDDIRDSKVAQTLGMPFAAATWGYLRQDFPIDEWHTHLVAHHPQELIGWLKVLSAK